jgi:hypothetical protein
MVIMNKKILIGLGAVWFLASIGSYFSQVNPPIANKVAWDSAKTKELFYYACADCHSHETEWPWYSQIAPLSFPIIYHVNDGREHFNISIEKMGDSDEAAEKLEEGKMPLESYFWMDAHSKLSDVERVHLIQGLKNTFGERGKHEEQDKH